MLNKKVSNRITPPRARSIGVYNAAAQAILTKHDFANSAQLARVNPEMFSFVLPIDIKQQLNDDSDYELWREHMTVTLRGEHANIEQVLSPHSAIGINPKYLDEEERVNASVLASEIISSANIKREDQAKVKDWAEDYSATNDCQVPLIYGMMKSIKLLEARLVKSDDYVSEDYVSVNSHAHTTAEKVEEIPDLESNIKYAPSATRFTPDSLINQRPMHILNLDGLSISEAQAVLIHLGGSYAVPGLKFAAELESFKYGNPYFTGTIHGIARSRTGSIDPNEFFDMDDAAQFTVLKKAMAKYVMTNRLQRSFLCANQLFTTQFARAVANTTEGANMINQVFDITLGRMSFGRGAIPEMLSGVVSVDKEVDIGHLNMRSLVDWTDRVTSEAIVMNALFDAGVQVLVNEFSGLAYLEPDVVNGYLLSQAGGEKGNTWVSTIWAVGGKTTNYFTKHTYADFKMSDDFWDPANPFYKRVDVGAGDQPFVPSKRARLVYDPLLIGVVKPDVSGFEHLQQSVSGTIVPGHVGYNTKLELTKFAQFCAPNKLLVKYRHGEPDVPGQEYGLWVPKVTSLLGAVPQYPEQNQIVHLTTIFTKSLREKRFNTLIPVLCSGNSVIKYGYSFTVGTAQVSTRVDAKLQDKFNFTRMARRVDRHAGVMRYTSHLTDGPVITVDPKQVKEVEDMAHKPVPAFVGVPVGEVVPHADEIKAALRDEGAGATVVSDGRIIYEEPEETTGLTQRVKKHVNEETEPVAGTSGFTSQAG